MEKTMLLTPEIAQDWIDNHYGKNRAINWAWVGELAELMKNGSWRPELPDSIITFDKSGNILNGHHRTYGVVVSGVSIWTKVVTDVDAELYDYFDYELVRNNRDFLDGKYTSIRHYLAKFIVCINDERCSTLTYALLGRLCNFRYANKNTALKPTRAKILDVEQENREQIMDVAEIASKIYRKNKIISANSIAAFYWVHRRTRDIQDFIDNLSYCETSDNEAIKGMYILLMRRSLDGKKKLDNVKMFLLLCHCYEIYKTNVPIKKLPTDSRYEKLEEKYTDLLLRKGE